MKYSIVFLLFFVFSFLFRSDLSFYQVLAYLGSISIGVQAMIILKVFIFLFSVWLTLKVLPRNNRILLLPIGFIFLHVLRERLEFRPEIFSFLSDYYCKEFS